MFLTQLNTKFLGMGHSIATRKNIVGFSFLSVALFVTIFSAQAFVQLSSADHAGVPDLIAFNIISPEDGGSSNIMEFVTTGNMTFMMEASSGTIKFRIFLGSDSSSAVSAEVNGEGCLSPNQACVVDQLFQSLIAAGGPPLQEGTYIINATYRSGHIESPNVDTASITHTIDRTDPDAPTFDFVNEEAISAGGAATQNTEMPKVNGTAEMDTTVVLYSNAAGLANSAIGEDVANSPWEITANQTLPEGQQTITANTTDAAGNTSPDASFTLTVDRTAPTFDTFQLH